MSEPLLLLPEESDAFVPEVSLKAQNGRRQEKATDLAAAAGLKVVGTPRALSACSYGGGSSYGRGRLRGSGAAIQNVHQAGGSGSDGIGADGTVALGTISVVASASNTARCRSTHLPGCATSRNRNSPVVDVHDGIENTPGSDLLSHTPTHAVPSAVAGLTSVFGMGTGVTLPL